MADLAEIGFAADTSGLDAAQLKLEKLPGAAGAVENANSNLSKSFQKVSDAASGVDNSLSDVISSNDNLAKSNVALAASGQKSETVMRAIEAAAKRSGVSYDEMAKRVDNVSKSTSTHTAASGAHTKALANNSDAANDNSKTIGKLAEIMAVLEAKELRVASNMGIFGEILSVIGPKGLAIAAALGAVVVVMDLLSSSANRMGDFAIQLQNVSILSKLSTTDLQSLLSLGVGFGLSTEQTTQYLIRFTEQLEQVRNGSGALYDQLIKIDPVLAAQISVAKDETTALNLLAQAYVKAGASKNALANAASGGRGGAQFGLLLSDIAQKGGVDGISSSVNKLDQLTKEQIATWSKLKIEIDDASLSARNNIASIYTTDVLKSEKEFADGMLEISRVLKSVEFSDDFKAMLSFFTSTTTLTILAGIGAVIAVLLAPISLVAAGLAALVTAAAAASAAIRAVQSVGAAHPSEQVISPGNNYSTFQSGAKTTLSATGNPLSADGQDTGSSAFKAAQAQALVSALGSAATAQQRMDASTKTLTADLEKGKITQETYNQAVAGLRTDAAIAQTQAQISALGSMATAQQRMDASTQTLTADLAKGKITQETYNLAVRGLSLDKAIGETQAQISALGSAATAQQRMNMQTQILAANLEKGEITQQTYNKAVAGLRFDNLISQTSLYVNALGELATTEDLIRVKAQQLAKDNQQGAGLTKEQITAIKNLTAAQKDQNDVNAMAQAGVFDMTLARKAANETLQSWIDKGLVDKTNTEQMAAAQLVLSRNIKATSDAAQVAAAPLQQLKQLQLDGSNFAKQLDTSVTGALNNMVSPIQDVMNHVTSLGQGFKNVGIVILKAIQEMVIKMLIITPIAKALMSILNPFASMFGGTVPGAIGPTSLGGAPLVSAKGNVFANDNHISTFANGGMFTNSIVSAPTLFKFAQGAKLGLMGEAGPEAIMPLKRGPNGSLGVQMYGQTSNDNSAVNVNHSANYYLNPGVTPQDLEAVKQAQEEDRNTLIQRVGAAIPELRRRGGKI